MHDASELARHPITRAVAEWLYTYPYPVIRFQLVECVGVNLGEPGKRLYVLSYSPPILGGQLAIYSDAAPAFVLKACTVAMGQRLASLN